MRTLPSSSTAAPELYRFEFILATPDQVFEEGSYFSLVAPWSPPTANPNPPVIRSSDRDNRAVLIPPAGDHLFWAGSKSSAWNQVPFTQSVPPVTSTLPFSSRTAAWPDRLNVISVGIARDVRNFTLRISVLAVAPEPVSPPVMSTVPSFRRVAVCPTLFVVIVGPSVHFPAAISRISVLSVGPVAVSPPATKMVPSPSITTAGDDLAISRDGASRHSYLAASASLCCGDGVNTDSIVVYWLAERTEVEAMIASAAAQYFQAYLLIAGIRPPEGAPCQCPHSSYAVDDFIVGERPASPRAKSAPWPSLLAFPRRP